MLESRLQALGSHRAAVAQRACRRCLLTSIRIEDVGVVDIATSGPFLPLGYSDDEDERVEGVVVLHASHASEAFLRNGGLREQPFRAVLVWLPFDTDTASITRRQPKHAGVLEL